MILIPLILIAAIDAVLLWYCPPIGVVMTVAVLCMLDGA